MIEILDSIDKQILLALNNDYSQFWDGFMFGFSGKFIWIFFYLSIVFVVFRKWKMQGFWILLAVVLCIVLADQIASGFFKETVKRFRPSHDLEIKDMVVLVNNYRSGLYGFVSSHAANSFGLALLTSLLIKNRTFTISIFIWAVVNSYSRIYLGVHYLGDILGGTIVGLATAYFIYNLIKKIKPSLLNENFKLPKSISIFPVFVLILSVVALVIYVQWFFQPLT